MCIWPYCIGFYVLFICLHEISSDTELETQLREVQKRAFMEATYEPQVKLCPVNDSRRWARKELLKINEFLTKCGTMVTTYGLQIDIRTVLLLYQIIERIGSKLTVVASEPQKTPKFSHRIWPNPILNCVNHLRIYHYRFLRN